MQLTGTLIDLEPARTRDATTVHGLAAVWAGVLAADFDVGAGDRVAICTHGSSDVFVLQLACARLGAALVPLSWRATPRELAAIVESARPAVVLHDGVGGTLARDVNAPLRSLATLPTAPIVAHPVTPDPDMIAQILYTSGTTGLPRGVTVRWRQLGTNAITTARTAQLTAADRVLACLPLFHTGGLNCLASPALAIGATVVIAPRFDPDQALAAIGEHRITAIIGVPAIYQRLLEAGLDRSSAPDLRVLLVGGAPVPATLIARYRELGFALRQGYGLTEAGPNCFDFGASDGPGVGTVGWPVRELEARLVDGELHLRGPQVTDAYLIDGALVDACDHQGWFHTGDLVEVTEHGYRIVGRATEMYISGGENVYPAEVELALASHPAIAEVAVIGVADPRWGEVGLAAIVARSPIAADVLARWARTQLAAFKVPRRWEICDELPHTATGKIARDVLRRRWT